MVMVVVMTVGTPRTPGGGVQSRRYVKKDV